MNNIRNVTADNPIFTTQIIVGCEAEPGCLKTQNNFELEPRLEEMKRALRDGYYKQFGSLH